MSIFVHFVISQLPLKFQHLVLFGGLLEHDLVYNGMHIVSFSLRVVDKERNHFVYLFHFQWLFQ